MAVQLGYRNVYRDPKGFPEWKAAGLPVESGPVGSATSTAPPEATGPLYGWAMIWTLLGVFAGGLALNLTPCVYPLIPITVSYFGGRSGQGRRKLAVHALLYVGGLALTNSVLGVHSCAHGEPDRRRIAAPGDADRRRSRVGLLRCESFRTLGASAPCKSDQRCHQVLYRILREPLHGV